MPKKLAYPNRCWSGSDLEGGLNLAKRDDSLADWVLAGNLRIRSA
jgi:hypothetical protein